MHAILDRMSILVLSGCKVKPHTTLGGPMTTSIVNYSLKSADTLLKIVVLTSVCLSTQRLFVFFAGRILKDLLYIHMEIWCPFVVSGVSMQGFVWWMANANSSRLCITYVINYELALVWCCWSFACSQKAHISSAQHFLLCPQVMYITIPKNITISLGTIETTGQLCRPCKGVHIRDCSAMM